MPFASGNASSPRVLLVAAILLVWKVRARGALCVLMLALILPLGDGMVCNTLKHALQRPRPYAALPDVRRPGQRRRFRPAMYPPPMAREATAPPAPIAQPALTSMPSSHAANWFAATMILFIYYRRSVWVMLPWRRWWASPASTTASITRATFSWAPSSARATPRRRFGR